MNNDGLQDIVTGTGQSWAGSEPLDVLYYSYNPASPSNFTENWIYTGLNMSCVSPVIGDFDGDTENELFFGGSWAGFSSVVLLDSPGDTAEIIWGDSIHAPSLASEGCFAVIDGAPAVVTTHILPSLPTGSHLALWTHIDGGFRFAWLSVLDDSAAYHDATVLDVDLDGKQNIIVASDIAHQIVDYEQPSSGIKGFGKTPGELEFALLPGYPNPFNGIITVPFELNKRADVRLSIYDITGRLVYSWQEENLLPGYYEVDWHAETEASGIYIFYLRSGEEVQTRKGVLLK
ncbi:T9SS type A sorting domain-containing protein [bacterium]|nr:T9SS type A sorting domain-containing protein [bacterium]